MHPLARWILALSDERDRWQRRLDRAYRAGYEQAIADLVDASLARSWPAPGHVGELEARRYGPGGRARFGDPRPGDFPGRSAAALRHGGRGPGK